jgi:hypothetical protein
MDGRGSTADPQPWRAERAAQGAKASAMAASGREQKERKKWSREGRCLGLGWGSSAVGFFFLGAMAASGREQGARRKKHSRGAAQRRAQGFVAMDREVARLLLIQARRATAGSREVGDHHGWALVERWE